jgi:hypothetical protein
MYINKDIARILSAAIRDSKINMTRGFSSTDSNRLLKKLECLQNNLMQKSIRKRKNKNGFDHFEDILFRMKVNNCNGIQGFF